MKKILVTLFYCLWVPITVFGQCPKYEKSLRKGNEMFDQRKYSLALKYFLIAMVAARECNVKDDQIAEKLSLVFNKVDELWKKANRDKKSAQQANKQTKKAFFTLKQERKKALSLQQLAISQSYASLAYKLSEKDPTQAAALALSSLQIHENDLATVALLKAFNVNSWFYSKSWRSGIADISLDGQKLAISGQSGLDIVTIFGGKQISLPYTNYTVKFLRNGNLLASTEKRLDTDTAKQEAVLLNKEGKVISRYEGSISNVSLGKEFMFAISRKHDRELWKMDGRNGKIETDTLPKYLEQNKILNLFAHDDFAVVYGNLPQVLYVTRGKGTGKSIPLPSGMEIGGIDFKGQRMLVHLVNKSENEVDGYAIIPLDSLESATEKLAKYKPMSKRIGLGIVKFLGEDRAVFSSVNGRTVFQSLRNNIEVKNINSSRAADAITVLNKENLVAICRRSGITSIYDFNGELKSNLTGNEPSDGSNVAYFSVATDSLNSILMTHSRDGIKIWQKPRYNLMIKKRIGRDLDSTDVSYFGKMHDQYYARYAMVDGNNFPLTRDEYGELHLKIELGRYVDNIRTGLNRNSSFLSSGIGPFNGYSIQLESGYTRLFMLDRAVVMPVLLKEVSDARLNGVLESAMLEGERGFNAKLLGRLNPVGGKKKHVGTN